MFPNYIVGLRVLRADGTWISMNVQCACTRSWDAAAEYGRKSALRMVSDAIAAIVHSVEIEEV